MAVVGAIFKADLSVVSINIYYALEIFREDAEYDEYFVPNKLSSVFYEVMGKPELREQWLGWDETLNCF